MTIAIARRRLREMIGNMQVVKARGGSIIALTTRGDNKLSAILDRSPRTSSWSCLRFLNY